LPKKTEGQKSLDIVSLTSAELEYLAPLTAQATSSALLQQRKSLDNADKELYNIVIYQQQQFFIEIRGRQKPD
jgi:hypothetical protein